MAPMSTITDNRITAAIAAIGERITAAIADDPAAEGRLEDAASLDTADWLLLGDKPSRAMLAGLVTADEAQILHGIHTRYNDGATLAERLTFLQIMSEVLTRC